MKISNSKRQLAKIIHENGGWPRDAESAAQCVEGEISFWHDTATKRRGEDWCGSYLGGAYDIQFSGGKLPNWHQTILSRDEYFHLYPAPDADGWIEHDGKHVPAIAGSGLTLWCKWSDGLEQSHEANMVDWIDDSEIRVVAYRLHKPGEGVEAAGPEPTIEQLAADYRAKLAIAQQAQEEADSHRCGAEAALSRLENACLELGLEIKPASGRAIADMTPKLNITDWRDLQVGDIIECIGNWENEATDGRQFAVTKLDPVSSQGFRPIRIEVTGVSVPGTWGSDFKFIRRP